MLNFHKPVALQKIFSIVNPDEYQHLEDLNTFIFFLEFIGFYHITHHKARTHFSEEFGVVYFFL